MVNRSRPSHNQESCRGQTSQQINYFFLGRDTLSITISEATTVAEVVRSFRRDVTQGTINQGLCIAIEDIDPRLGEILTTLIGAPASFFNRYRLSSPFAGLSGTLFAESTSSLPSQACSDNAINIHFQRVVALGTPGLWLDPDSYKLQTDDNAQRPVRPVLESSERALAFVASCFSIWRTKLENSCWICLMLVDSTTADVVPVRPGPHSSARSTGQIRTTQVSHHLLSSEPPPLSGSGVLPSNPQGHPQDIPTTMLRRLYNAFRKAPPTSFTADMSLIELAQPAIDMIVEEWMCYTLCMGRSVKVHEPVSSGSGSDIDYKATERNMIELFRWRRRSQRSLSKLQNLADLIEYPPNRFLKSDTLARDVRFIITQIEQYRDLLEAMVPMLTSTLQIADSRRAIREAIYVKNLTYLALIFLPLSLVASLLSINGDFAVDKGKFWVYFVVAVPLLVLVLAVSHYAPFGALVTKQLLSDGVKSKHKDRSF